MGRRNPAGGPLNGSKPAPMSADSPGMLTFTTEAAVAACA
jgi:hypothetical protein